MGPAMADVGAGVSGRVGVCDAQPGSAGTIGPDRPVMGGCWGIGGTAAAAPPDPSGRRVPGSGGGRAVLSSGTGYGVGG
jgi:hypothetical protein